MATKIPSSARVSFTLNAGVNPSSGAMLKQSVSLGYIMPGSEINALAAVTGAIQTLFAKPTVSVSLIETARVV